MAKIIRADVRELNHSEKEGFACNTNECPCSADYGVRCVDGNGVSDVRCESCALTLNWVSPTEIETKGKLQFPICSECGQRHYRKAGKKCEFVRSSAQIERQKEQHRNHGQYAKVNPCYVCGKSAGVDYCSHHDTDGLINDELLCLCKKCATKLEKYDGKTAIEIAFGNKENEVENMEIEKTKEEIDLCLEYSEDKETLKKVLAEVKVFLSKPTLKKHFEEDKEERNCYTVIVKRGRDTITFSYGDSIYNTKNGKTPRLYDILCGCGSDYNCPDSFKEFCSEFGYDEDSRKAEQLHKKCLIQSTKLRDIFEKSEAQSLPS